MLIDEATERVAIERLRQGDPGGLEILVQQYQNRAIRTAYLITQDWLLAEDVAQTAFLNAYARIAQFDPSRAFGPWFLRSVAHAAIKATQVRQRSLPIDTGAEEETDRVKTWLIDPRQRPEELVETRELQEQVRRALAQLSPEQRAAVVLHYFLEDTEREMAAELGRPRTTVKWWLHVARQKLRQLLAPTAKIIQEERYE